MEELNIAKKIQRDPQDVEIANTILDRYNPETRDDVQNALKRIFGPIFEAMLQGEMNAHLGYESNNHEYKETQNRRNGYGSKTLKIAYGEIPINVPRDRDATFEPLAIPKRTKNISGIEDKVLSMYAKGMSQRDIADTIEDIYGFNISAETESESKHNWMQIFDELKTRGVEDVLFISMDGVSGLEEGAKAIFKNVVVQRCIVHLIRNSIKYVPSKSYKAFTAQLKKVYGAPSLKAAEAEFEKFKQTWSEYLGAVDVWVRNWKME